MWTKFEDMYSGGVSKENPIADIYVELPEARAIDWFENHFGHHPFDVLCPCCGEDYDACEYETIEQATKGQRGTQTVEEYEKRKDVLIFRAKDIKE